AKRLNAMNQAIASVIAARKTLKSLPAWGDDIKASDDFLTPVFQNYFEILGTTVLVKKSDFYQLVDCMSREEIDPEIGEKLDAISKVAKSCPSLPATAGSE
ncbi:MAG: hypothetical protein OXC81_03310, partial [Betaproteobacteria bacterium]|nr:hypothetical protein [Betaproteobacteria bacterium]